jgi:hypothetical protein
MPLTWLSDLFPHLQKLRLNNSIIPSMGDISGALVQLRFLSLSHCVGGVSAVLEELSLAFNRVSDVLHLMDLRKLCGRRMPSSSRADVRSDCGLRDGERREGKATPREAQVRGGDRSEKANRSRRPLTTGSRVRKQSSSLPACFRDCPTGEGNQAHTAIVVEKICQVAGCGRSLTTFSIMGGC